MHSNKIAAEGTARRKERFESAESGSRLAAGHFRAAQGIWLSSIGIGTYLGNWDEQTDKNYADAVRKYVDMGGNVIDTASNYRFQRSERNIGDAIRGLGPEYPRDELFVCTKAGYLPFDHEPPADVKSYFESEFVKKGIATFDELVGGSHCMTPDYLNAQIEQSLKNMDLDYLDLFYIHNPEAQLAEVDRYTFEARIALAFEKLESIRSEGKIGFYGIATWNGFRVQPGEQAYHSLERFVNIAEQVGGAENGFKFVQLPVNLAMPEAYLLPNQAIDGKAVSLIEAAKNLGISVIASASLLQGKLAMNVPIHIREAFGGLTTDAMTSLQFVRSMPGVTTALVGMSSSAHVDENMTLAEIEPAPEKSFDIFSKEMFG